MIVMLFEYWLHPDHLDEYGQHAQLLRQLVQEIDGFISIERYRSETDPEKLLALGVFRDEAAVRAWRQLPEHRRAQALGRERLMTDYRLRMATIDRDYSLRQRRNAPIDSQQFHQTHSQPTEEV
jgi:heme-degrading monooxygenase HmoA